MTDDESREKSVRDSLQVVWILCWLAAGATLIAVLRHGYLFVTS